jgi:FKBP-type peptidyl-prolyl cis-trans isomerase SlyD
MNDDLNQPHSDPINHITPQCVVALTWTLQDTLGEELDVLADPVEFVVGGSDLLPKIDEALQGHKVGDKLDLHLEPEDAFGDFIDKLIFLEPRKLFPKQIEEGMGFEGLPPGCNPDAPKELLYTITEIYPEHVVLDANHPLAGIAIRLHLKIESIRQATEEEIGTGSAGVGFFKMGGGTSQQLGDDSDDVADDGQYRSIKPADLRNLH